MVLVQRHGLTDNKLLLITILRQSLRCQNFHLQTSKYSWNMFVCQSDYESKNRRNKQLNQLELDNTSSYRKQWIL